MLPADTYFITGTDTGVGKTFITQKLLMHFKQRSFSALAMKPIASGCEPHENTLKNEDACVLQASATHALPYEMINPFAFAPPIAPHIAAEQVGARLTQSNIKESIQRFLDIPADIHLIEGAGGWLLPINAFETLADVIAGLHLKVILVVKMQLGCLNHALLTYQSIKSHGLTLAGWVANTINEPMTYLDENIAYLTAAFNQTPVSL